MCFRQTAGVDVCSVTLNVRVFVFSVVSAEFMFNQLQREMEPLETLLEKEQTAAATHHSD